MDPFKPYEPRVRTARPRLTVTDAEAVALQAVAWIVGRDEMRDRFIAVTGCGAEELRHRVAQPTFLGCVLDFLLADEGSVLAFTEHAGLTPETPLLARAKLPNAATN